MEEFRKSNEENSKVFKDEIRKLKAVIVKHENRIRALEAEREKTDVPDSTAGDAGPDSSRKEFAPDEV